MLYTKVNGHGRGCVKVKPIGNAFVYDMMKFLLHSWLGPDGVCSVYVYYDTTNNLNPSENATLKLSWSCMIEIYDCDSMAVENNTDGPSERRCLAHV